MKNQTTGVLFFIRGMYAVTLLDFGGDYDTVVSVCSVVVL